MTNANEHGFVGAEEAGRLIHVGEVLQVAAPGLGIEPASPQTDARVGVDGDGRGRAGHEARDERDGRDDGHDAGGTIHGGALPWYGAKAISTRLVGPPCL